MRCSARAVSSRPSASATVARSDGSRLIDVHGVHRPGQGQIGEVEALFDQVEHQCRGAHLEVGRRLRKVGVADDDVQAPVLVGVGMRLVAGVDDAALERGLQTDLDLDVVGALRQLEAGLVARRTDSHPARAGDHLARHQEGRQARR